MVILYEIENMRIIARNTLKEFWNKYVDSEQELKSWYLKIRNADYKNPNEVISESPSADNIGNNRIVFNICHNKYRLIVVFRYKLKRVYIRFIGTHKEYDKIENIKEI